MDLKRCAFLIFAFANLHLVLCDFEIDFLGSRDEEFQNQSLCWTDVCMQDSGRLIYSASHEYVDPCEDFPKFAMGEFLKHRVPSERYAKLGFQSEIDALYLYKQKQALLAPAKENLPTVIKVMKSLFKKCINSEAIIKNGAHETISYLKRLNLPIVRSEQKWDEDSFDIQTLFNANPEIAFPLFFDLNVGYFYKPTNLLSVPFDPTWSYDVNVHEDVTTVLRHLKLNANVLQEIISDYIDFLKQKLPSQNMNRFSFNSSPFPILNDTEKAPDQSLTRILTSFIKNQNAKAEPSHVIKRLTVNDASVKSFSNILENKSKKSIANIFTVAFFLKYQKAFIVYPFTKKDENFYGTKRSHQRFEQCLEHLAADLKQPFDALMANKLLDKKVLTAATEFAKEIYDDVVGNDGLFEHVKSLRFSDEDTNITAAGIAYKNLALDGSESLIEMYVGVDRFKHWAEMFESERYGTFQTEDLFEEGDILIPIKLLLYPSFEPNRPRFFNMAYFSREFLSTVGAHGTINAAYESYSRWLSKGNQDLRLPGFKMTSRQMFWLAAVHVATEKYQRGVSPIFEVWRRLTSKFMHVIVKNIRQFREDFECDAMTSDEMSLFESYREKASLLAKISKKGPTAYAYSFTDDDFKDFEMSGVLDFIESVMTAPENAADLKVFKDSRKENKFQLENMRKILELICADPFCGQLFSFEETNQKF